MILLKLTPEKKRTIMEVANAINKDRTTVQKSLTRLLELGWVEKRQLNMARGFCFVFVQSKNPIKLAIEEQKKQNKEKLEKLSELL